MRTIDHEADRVEALARQRVTVVARFEIDAKNFAVRILHDRLPVIHLAFATAQFIEMSQRGLAAQPADVRDGFRADVGGPDGQIRPQFGIGDLLTCEEMQRFIIQRAEALEPLLPTLMPRRRLDRIVRFRSV